MHAVEIPLAILVCHLIKAEAFSGLVAGCVFAGVFTNLSILNRTKYYGGEVVNECRTPMYS